MSNGFDFIFILIITVIIEKRSRCNIVYVECIVLITFVLINDWLRNVQLMYVIIQNYSILVLLQVHVQYPKSEITIVFDCT